MAYRTSLSVLLILQSVLLLQAGCSHFEPRPIKKDNKIEGPGLFSGEKGYFDPIMSYEGTAQRKEPEEARGPLDLPPDYKLRAPTPR